VLTHVASRGIEKTTAPTEVVFHTFLCAFLTFSGTYFITDQTSVLSCLTSNVFLCSTLLLFRCTFGATKIPIATWHIGNGASWNLTVPGWR
jgi:hypothetical protein